MIDAVPDQVYLCNTHIGTLDWILLYSKGAVYMKNCIFKYWREKDPADTNENFYTIPEHPKSIVREHIVNDLHHERVEQHSVTLLNGTGSCRHGQHCH